MLEFLISRGFGTILDSLNDGIIGVDGNCIVVLFNKAAERITGLKKEDVMGRCAIDAIPNTRLPFIVKSGEIEMNRQQNLGHTVIITSRIPLKDEKENVIGAIAVFRDITEIKDLTEQVSGLWRLRTLLEAIIEATEDAISVADENGNNIIVNSAYTRITGFPKEAVINRPVTTDIAEGESMHLQVLKTGKPVRNVRMKVGPAKKAVIVNVAPVIVEGRICGSVGVIHDISEIISLNENLAQAKKLIRHLKADYTLDDITGKSPVIEIAKEHARRAAETPATVLLRGESGTGKELFAHAIHNASSRSRGQFVRVNCAAISEDLLESELFGYEEGAFTGALKGGKIGLFEEATRGTIFLDEIGEISLSLQKKLLRVLQEKEIVKVGGTGHIAVDVRIITATNADLEQKIREKSFREDLYYRLNVIPIHIPPLRDRRTDIPLLVEQIIYSLNQEFGREVQNISSAALEILMDYNWPGNVRELENIIGRAMINMKYKETTIEVEHLPLLGCEKTSQTFLVDESRPVQPLAQTTAEAEKAAIIRALKETGDNREKTAALLDIAIRNLYYKIRKYGIK